MKLAANKILAFFCLLGLSLAGVYTMFIPYFEDKRRFAASPIIPLSMSVDYYLGFALIERFPNHQAVLRSGNGINPNVLMLQFEANKVLVAEVLSQISPTIQDNTSRVLEYWTCKTIVACPANWLVFKRPRTRNYQTAPRQRLFVFIDDLENQLQRVHIIKYLN